MEQKALINPSQSSKNPVAPKILVANGSTIGPDGSHYSTYEEFAEDAKSVTGTPNEDLACALINLVARVQGPISEGTVLAANNAIALFTDFKCRNTQETILCINIIALHSHATKLFIKAAKTSDSELQLNCYNMALKLFKSLTAGLETLQKNKRNGTYTMKVEHLHVHSGAQAIIGAMNRAQKEGEDY